VINAGDPMKNCKLILIEGIPGSGKSTTAQYVSNVLGKNKIIHKWWYEEEKGHPVYIYKDHESLQQVVANLSNGNYREVIDRALEQWEEISSFIQASDEIIIVDSCLFGYLTWSLFPYNVPIIEIKEYALKVEGLISGCNPQLIYLYQNDIHTALTKICERRSGDTKKNFTNAATGSAYCLSRGLSGFDGLSTYWQDYRVLTDDLFNDLRMSRISINNSEGDWQLYNNEILKFLEIDMDKVEPDANYDIHKFVGIYQSKDKDHPVSVIVNEEGMLVADGLPHVWTKTVLIPRSSRIFDVQSLPFHVTFEEDYLKNMQIYLSGSALFDGPVDYIFIRNIGI
jgi:thymidylate kinase